MEGRDQLHRAWWGYGVSATLRLLASLDERRAAAEQAWQQRLAQLRLALQQTRREADAAEADAARLTGEYYAAIGALGSLLGAVRRRLEEAHEELRRDELQRLSHLAARQALLAAHRAALEESAMDLQRARERLMQVLETGSDAAASATMPAASAPPRALEEAGGR